MLFDLIYNGRHNFKSVVFETQSHTIISSTQSLVSYFGFDSFRKSTKALTVWFVFTSMAEALISVSPNDILAWISLSTLLLSPPGGQFSKLKLRDPHISTSGSVINWNNWISFTSLQKLVGRGQYQPVIDYLRAECEEMNLTLFWAKLLHWCEWCENIDPSQVPIHILTSKTWSKGKKHSSCWSYSMSGDIFLFTPAKQSSSKRS